MPIYEYECPVCGVFEAVQKATDKPLKANPGCAHANCPRKAKRIMSASAFHLKGSGWYKTDYASSSSSGSGTASKSSKGSGTSGDSGGTDSTSTDKTPAKKDAASKKGGSSGGGCGSGCGCH